jgi:hypothetical protein
MTGRNGCNAGILPPFRLGVLGNYLYQSLREQVLVDALGRSVSSGRGVVPYADWIICFLLRYERIR